MKTIEELGSDLSHIEVPETIIGLIVWLGENGSDSEKILQDYVLSTLHLDAHFEKIVSHMMGHELTGDTFFNSKVIKGTIDYKGNICTQNFSDRVQTILKGLLNGDNKDFQDVVKYIEEVYQPDDMYVSSVIEANTIGVENQFDEEKKQEELIESELRNHKGVLSDEQISELKKEILQYVLGMKASIEEGKKLDRINQSLFSLFQIINEYEACLKKIDDEKKALGEVSELQVQYSPRITRIANVLRPIVNRFITPEPDSSERLPVNVDEKNVLRKIINVVQLANKEDELEQALQADGQVLDTTKKYLYAKTIEATSEIVPNCHSTLYRKAVEVLPTVVSKGIEVEVLKEYLYRLSFASDRVFYETGAGEMQGFNENEYTFCSVLFSSVERFAKDIRNNIEIGKKLYSPELVGIRNFEELCLEIRKAFKEEKIDEIDGIKDYGSTITEYRSKTRKTEEVFCTGLALNQDEIKEQMGKLNQRYQELLQLDNKEEYIRGVADLLLDFLMLHPYFDGNGRTSRALFPVLMAQKGIVAPALIESYRDRYNRTEFTYFSSQAAKAKIKKSEDQKALTDWENYVIKRVIRYNPELKGLMSSISRDDDKTKQGEELIAE